MAAAPIKNRESGMLVFCPSIDSCGGETISSGSSPGASSEEVVVSKIELDAVIGSTMGSEEEVACAIAVDDDAVEGFVPAERGGAAEVVALVVAGGAGRGTSRTDRLASKG